MYLTLFIDVSGAHCAALDSLDPQDVWIDDFRNATFSKIASMCIGSHGYGCDCALQVKI
jgi:hypothetical protein